MSWNYVKDKLPICYASGDWDGKKSSNIVAETKSGKQFLGVCYEGTLDGNYFFDWYSINEIIYSDWLVTEEIMRWFEIPN